jgi:hypothetical protein
MSVIISIVLCCFFVNMELFSGVLMDCTEKFYARPHYPVTYRPSFEVVCTCTVSNVLIFNINIQSFKTINMAVQMLFPTPFFPCYIHSLNSRKSNVLTSQFHINCVFYSCVQHDGFVGRNMCFKLIK